MVDGTRRDAPRFVLLGPQAVIAVYTALFGPGQPTTLPVPPASAPSTTYTVVTDQDRDFPGWIVCRQPLMTQPQQQARWVKTTPPVPAPVSLWVDATFELLVDPGFIVQQAEQTGAPIVGFCHPDRKRMVEEARAVMRWGLADRARVKAQMAAYQASGFDTDAAPQTQLTTTGLLVRWDTPAVVAFNQLWWRHLQEYTLRDQLSIDYCAWAMQLPIGYLPGHYRANPFARYDRRRRTPRLIHAS